LTHATTRVGIDDVSGFRQDRRMQYEIKRSRGATRVRETAPAYGQSAPAPPQVYHVAMGGRGRLVLPAEIRERLKIREGDRLAVRVEPDGSLTVLTAKAAAARMYGAFAHLAPGRNAVAELIAERRREAAMEERDTRALVARPRRKIGR